MNKKTYTIGLVVLGLYFLLFHTPPWPLNHEAIGLPPYHGFHTLVGVVLIGMAVFITKRKAV